MDASPACSKDLPSATCLLNIWASISSYWSRSCWFSCKRVIRWAIFLAGGQINKYGVLTVLRRIICDSSSRRWLRGRLELRALWAPSLCCLNARRSSNSLLNSSSNWEKNRRWGFRIFPRRLREAAFIHTWELILRSCSISVRSCSTLASSSLYLSVSLANLVSVSETRLSRMEFSYNRQTIKHEYYFLRRHKSRTRDRYGVHLFQSFILRPEPWRLIFQWLILFFYSLEAEKVGKTLKIPKEMWEMWQISLQVPQTSLWANLFLVTCLSPFVPGIWE